MFPRSRAPGLRASERIRYAWCDLRSRPTMTLLSLSAVSVAVVYLLGLGFYGASLYRYQEALLADTLSRRVVASCPEVTDLGRRFTAETIARLLREPEIELVFPRVELGVKLANGLQHRRDVTAESTVPRDPGLAASRLSWGRAVSGPLAHEVVVPRALFEAMGGTLSDDGPRPELLALEVGRTADGRPQVDSMTVRVVGLLKSGGTDRVYLPLGLAEQLDQWCSHKIRALPGVGARPDLPRAAIESAVAYGPEAFRDRVAGEAAQFRVDIRPLGDLTVVEAARDPWSVVRGAPGLTADRIRDLLPPDFECTVAESHVLETNPGWGRRRIVALSEDDPRWRESPGGHPPEFGHILAARPSRSGSLAFAGLLVPVDGQAPDLAGNGDYYGTPLTLNWLAYEGHLKPVDAEATPVPTSDPPPARRPDDAAPRDTPAPPRTLRVHLGLGIQLTDVLCTTVDPSAGPIAVPAASVLMDQVPKGVDHACLSPGGGPGCLLRVHAESRVPSGTVWVDASTFRRLAFEADRLEGRLRAAGTPEVMVQVAPIRFLRLREVLAKDGLMLEPVIPVARRCVIEYQVRSLDPTDAPLDADRVAALALSQPTFFAALPRLGVPVALGGREATLEGSTAADPRQFRAGVGQGRWLSPRATRPEVVLPAEVACVLNPDRTAASWIGREVDATFVRDRGVGGRESTLTLALRVVGVAGGMTGFAPLELVQGVALWREGKVVYNDARKEFEAPALIYRRSGHVRCNIDVRALESLPAVVDRLEHQGYRTEHHLAEQQGLQKLGRVLVFLVLLFVIGFAASAVITVLITNAMTIAGKTHEIGILRAHGVGTSEIVAIFGIQGLTCGGIAFALGGLFVAGVEPRLTGLLRETFQLPPESIPVPLLSAANGTLFAMAFVLAVLAALTGAVLPALQACRLTPVQALRRPE